MAEAVVSVVVARLGDLIIQESKFLHEVSDQVEAARTELQLVQGFLKDADVRQRDDETYIFLKTLKKARLTATGVPAQGNDFCPDYQQSECACEPALHVRIHRYRETLALLEVDDDR
ncbi:hypothetical protein ACFX13_012082 [Malus domestica]